MELKEVYQKALAGEYLKGGRKDYSCLKQAPLGDLCFWPAR